MGELIWFASLVLLTGFMSWHVGVRYERGKWMRLEEATAIQRKQRKGTKLRRIRVSR